MGLKNKKSDNTPVRNNLVSAATKLTTSPYFCAPSLTSGTKRKVAEDPEGHNVARSTPNRLASAKKEMRLITSPYFAPTTTPRQTSLAKLEFEAKEEKRRERKRQRLQVRGDTPEELPPPPSSPNALAQTLRSIKPELVQEKVRDDPWKIIVATTLLNKTTGRAALPVYWKLLEQWPTPRALAQAAAPSLTRMLQHLGTQSLRTERLMRLSNAYVMHPPHLLTPVAKATSSQPSSPDLPVPSSFIKSTQTSEASSLAEFPRQFSPKEYRAIQQATPIAHLPFAGPYAIDSFRIYSPDLPGGGAPTRVEEQLERIARLPKVAKGQVERDDFDETPLWYDPGLLRVNGDDDAEWRQVRPDDKELRRYLVWRWAIEGVAYNPEAGHTFGPASWLYLNYLIRK
ncbi:hypothetical protein FS749_007190 [Ceratobasidium sp. UAMH 11750]|nr:hypothetical protein FS749_007190 [Ceratobasidium sp. UAMH 11750]